MFGTGDYVRGGLDSQSYDEDVDIHMPSPGATVLAQYADVEMPDAPAPDATGRTWSQEDCYEDADVDMTDAPDLDVTVHTQSQQDRHEDVDVDMLDAAVIDATSCTQTDDLDPIKWTPTGTPEEGIALEMEAYRKMRVAKWVETECLWQSTRGA